jgi:hypothetical protein
VSKRQRDDKARRNRAAVEERQAVAERRHREKFQALETVPERKLGTQAIKPVLPGTPAVSAGGRPRYGFSWWRK